MSKSKPYKEQSAAAASVAEPIVSYAATTTDNVVFLPEDILVAAIKYADIAEQNNRLIPHEEVSEHLNHRLGWK